MKVILISCIFITRRIDAVELGFEQRLKLPQMATHNQIEATICFLKAITGVLFILNFFKNRSGARWILKVSISVSKFSPDVGAPRQLTNQYFPCITDTVWRHVLVGFWIAQHSRDMNTTLMRESRGSNKRLSERAVITEQFPDSPRYPREVCKVAGR